MKRFNVLIIYSLLFQIFFYTPAIVNWYSETYILDVVILVFGGIFFLIYILNILHIKSNYLNKIKLLVAFIFLYFSFSYAASGDFLNPVYGVKQLIFFFSFFLFYYILGRVNYKIIFLNFFKFFVIYSLVIYFSGIGMGFMSNSLLPRFYIPPLNLFSDFQLIGSSAILTGTFSAISFAYFLSNKDIKNSKFYLYMSLLLVLLSGTRAAFLEIIFIYLLSNLFEGKFFFFIALKNLIFIFIIVSPIVYVVYGSRLTDSDSNSVHLLLWGMSVAMFIDSPIFGQGVNTFHSIKNNFVDYTLPESYGVHSTLFKFLGEGGLFLLFSYFLFWILLYLFWKNKKYINKSKNMYKFSLLAYFAIMFHSIFDNFIMAKVDEYLFVVIIVINLLILKLNKITFKTNTRNTY